MSGFADSIKLIDTVHSDVRAKAYIRQSAWCLDMKILKLMDAVHCVWPLTSELNPTYGSQHDVGRWRFWSSWTPFTVWDLWRPSLILRLSSWCLDLKLLKCLDTVHRVWPMTSELNPTYGSQHDAWIWRFWSSWTPFTVSDLWRQS